jgi:hypothetical protein
VFLGGFVQQQVRIAGNSRFDTFSNLAADPKPPTSISSDQLADEPI